MCPGMQKDECQVLYTLSNNKDDPRLVSLHFGAISSASCLHSALEKGRIVRLARCRTSSTVAIH